MNSRRSTPDRRGVLLLLVLSCLTLFMMLGAIMLVLATRARTTSRAFAAASNAVSRDAIRTRSALDEALMALLRGPLPGGGATSITESILADRYGTAVTMGEVAGLAINAGTLQAALTGVTAATPLALNGRVLTIKPQAGDPAPVASYRIVNFAGGVATLANLRGAQPFRQRPSRFPCMAIVSGRDFDNSAGNETWDKADAANPFLTDARLVGADVAVTRPAFGAVSGTCSVDNDADGVADGIWLSDVLQPQRQENGGDLNFRVSYLVLDLDGRFNVNAHGGLASSGTIGPALVDGSAVFANDAWSSLTGRGTTISGSSPLPTAQQRRPRPALGYAVDGRLGNMSSATNPYTLRLDLNGPRPGSPTLAGEPTTSGTIASLFTAGELERVLRPFDADACDLPPRLAAILGDEAQKARMLVTTDGWDTTGLAGTAASKIMSGTTTSGLPQEVVEGRRFNINASMANKATYCDWLYNVILAAGVNDEKTRQWVANVVEYRDKDTDTAPITIAGTSITGHEAPEYGSNGGNPTSEVFTSIGQLLCVPRGSKDDLASGNTQLSDEEKKMRRSLVVDHPVILDAVTVPSPFTSTLVANPWREPGRVNVNTSADEVWKAMIGENVGNPFNPAQSAGTMLTNATFMFTGPEAPDRPFTAVQRQRANRVANIATTRSNVFAVWITVEMSEADAPKRYGRLFAIVDRSIPVGYCPGVNLNARDAVRLVRYLD